MVYGLPSTEQLEVCEGCLLGKQTCKSFPTSAAWRASMQLELIHVEVCGPMQRSHLEETHIFYFSLMTIPE